MAKQSNSKNFYFKRGERLEVLDRFVRVYNKDSGDRFYSFNGKLLGNHSVREIKIAEKQHNEILYIPLSGCILIKEGDFWNLFSFNGEKICDKPICKVDLNELKKGFVILHYKEKNKGEQSAVFSTIGECIIPFGSYKFNIHLNYIIVECYNGKFKLYDVQLKKFLEGEFEEIKPFFYNAILKTTEGYFLYNTKTKSKELKFDVCLDLLINKFSLHFYELHYQGRCGLYATYIKNCLSRKRFLNLVLPIEFQKFDFTDQGVVALKDGVSEFYQYDYIISQNFSQEIEQSDSQVSKECDLNNESSVKLFGKIEIKSGEIAIFGRKFIAIQFKQERFNDKVYYKYFALDGTYIGESDSIFDEYEDTELSYIDTKAWIALSDFTTQGFNRRLGNWTLYNYYGKKIFDVEFSEIYKQFHYYIANQNSTFKKSSKENFIAIFTISGNLLFTLKNYFRVDVFHSKYFQAEDFDEKYWFYDSEGKLIFDEGLDIRKALNVGDTFWIEYEEVYKIYDLITRKVYKIKVDKIEEQYIQSAYFYTIYFEGKCGIFTCTDERPNNFKIVGLKEIVPAIYEKVDVCGEFLRAVKEGSEAVYDLSGNLIATTEK